MVREFVSALVFQGGESGGVSRWGGRGSFKALRVGEFQADEEEEYSRC